MHMTDYDMIGLCHGKLKIFTLTIQYSFRDQREIIRASLNLKLIARRLSMMESYVMIAFCMILFKGMSRAESMSWCMRCV